jgi:hypothetical protein
MYLSQQLEIAETKIRWNRSQDWGNEAATYYKERFQQALALIIEADAYLNFNKLTTISSGSILHQKFKDLITVRVHNDAEAQQ